MAPPPAPVLLESELVSVNAPPVVSKPIVDPARRPLLFTVVRLPSSAVTAEVENPLVATTLKTAAALLETMMLAAVQRELEPP